MSRYARNKRLSDAAQQWAFSSMRGSAGAKAYYQQPRGREMGHHAALRQLADRWVGILHGCLKTGTRYDEHTAWAHIVQPSPGPGPEAAALQNQNLGCLPLLSRREQRR